MCQERGGVRAGGVAEGKTRAVTGSGGQVMHDLMGRCKGLGLCCELGRDRWRVLSRGGTCSDWRFQRAIW